MLMSVVLSGVALAKSFCQDPNESLIETADKAAICLHHYPEEGPPVLLVHGISSNAAFWDVSDGLSVAKTLQANGLDVWAIDERGHGEAKQTKAKKRQRHGWQIDDYGFYDIDAAIRHIQLHNPNGIHYIGHSLGGMALAPYLYMHGANALESITVMGSPMNFQHPDLLWQLSNRVAYITPPHIPTDYLAWMGSLFPKNPFQIDEMLFAPGSMTGKERRQMYQRVVSPMTRQEVLQLHHAMKNGAFLSSDGTDYRTVLAETETRTLVIAGRGDYVAPTDRVYGYYTAMGSSDKHWLVVGTDFGFEHDYGHLDMVISQSAQREIIPLLVDWINRSDTQSVFPTGPLPSRQDTSVH